MFGLVFLTSLLKWENALNLKLVLTGNLLLLCWISLDYYHRQVFVDMHANKNLSIMKLIIFMPGINWSCIMFSHCFVAVLYVGLSSNSRLPVFVFVG